MNGEPVSIMIDGVEVLLDQADLEGQQVVEITVLVAMGADGDEHDATALAEAIERDALQPPPTNPDVWKPTGRVIDVKLRPMTPNDVKALMP